MEQDHRYVWAARLQRLKPIEIDEITIRGVFAYTPDGQMMGGSFLLMQTSKKDRVDGLQMPAWKPKRRLMLKLHDEIPGRSRPRGHER